MGQLGDSYTALESWRGELDEAVGRYGHWLEGLDPEHAAFVERLEKVHQRLKRDKLTVAFVAEFSRGKSELINAIFFGDHGRRILPSSAGRTTMCPTELYYNADEPIGIRLLPIETRLRDVSMADLRESQGDWRQVSVNSSNSEELANVFQMVKETKSVSVDEAMLLGFNPEDEGAVFQPDLHGMIEVPRWRHALINIAHPLLELGLVIIDTPGLNAIGLEPELTLSMIPNADAVLFVLAADTGVTKTDIDVWRDCISASHQSGRMVVLNKIDGLWDNIRDEKQIELELSAQVSSVAKTLEISSARVYPVSAQKALAARVNGDDALLKRSRLPELEAALANEIVPKKHTLVREFTKREFDDVHKNIDAHLAGRRRQLVEQLFELSSLRGKNSTVVGHMATRVAQERDDFESSARHLQALRSVFNRQSEVIYSTLSVDSLKRHVRDAREQMKASRLSTGLKEGMSQLLTDAQKDMAAVSKAVEEITSLMSVMYKTFNSQHGLTLGAPMVFSTLRFVQELERIDTLQKQQFGAMALVTTERWALTRKFFETVASRLKELYDRARKDVEVWLRAVLAPIEGQVREHQAQLKRRVDSLKRIREAEDTLEVKIFELEEHRSAVEQQIAICTELGLQVMSVLSMPFPSANSNLIESAMALKVIDAEAEASEPA
jgi:Dynamin family